MLITPVTVALISFIAGLAMLTGGYLMERGFARLAGRGYIHTYERRGLAERRRQMMLTSGRMMISAYPNQTLQDE